jgi:hypothetical protein
MIEEVIYNAERGDNGGGSSGESIEPTTGGTQSEPRGISGGTESESESTGNRESNVQGNVSTDDSGDGESQGHSEVDERGDSGDRSESLERNESDEERRRRIKRERDREYRARKRREQLGGNPSDTRTSTTGGTRGSSGSQNPSSLVLVNKQATPKEPKVNPTSTKTKGVRKGNKDDVNTDELTAFIIGVFNLAGGLAGSHWFVTEDEANQIAEPLTRIMNKMNKKKKSKVNDYMAPMLLITAIGSILVPRLMITTMEWREKANERKRNKLRTSPIQTIPTPPSVGEQAPRGDGEQPERRNDGENAPQFVPTVPPEIGGLFKE